MGKLVYTDQCIFHLIEVGRLTFIAPDTHLIEVLMSNHDRPRARRARNDGATHSPLMWLTPKMRELAIADKKRGGPLL